MVAQRHGGAGTLADPMPKGLRLDLHRKLWLMENFRRAREAAPDMTQGEVAWEITIRFRAEGLIKPTEVVLPGVVARWEVGTSAPAGRRLLVACRWVAERLKEPMPAEERPDRKRSGSLSPAERRLAARKDS